MDWRIKCAAQHVLSVLPGGRKLNYLMQRYVQRSLPVSDRKLAECRSAAARHLSAYEDVRGRKPRDVFEFGAGQCLGVPIVVGMAGCKVFATDVAENAAPFVVSDALRRLGGPATIEDAGVTYCAPYSPEMAADASFDLVMSTSVLEHVPAEQIPALLADCRRVLRTDGLCSFLIDYKDHWANFDRSITVHNFMRYGALAWPFFNPSLQYQNRLRHSDYVFHFKSAGLHIVDMKPIVEDPPTFPLALEFRHYRDADLRTTGAHFVLSR